MKSTYCATFITFRQYLVDNRLFTCYFHINETYEGGIHMLESMEQIQRVAQQYNNIHNIRSIYNDILPDKSYANMQKLRDVFNGTTDISLQSLQINKNMRKALGIDHLESMKQLEHSIDMLRQNTIGNLSQIFFNECLKVYNSIRMQIGTDKYLESVNGIFKQYRINEEIVGNWQTISYSYPKSVKGNNNQAIFEDQSAYSEEGKNEIKEANTKILEEILTPKEHNAVMDQKSSIIVLSPINAKVLKYLSENPEALYQLSSGDFEIVMAEIYSKLGYDVTRTQATRDGGKDLIIRKPEILGDFVYYVECKKYAAKRHVGVGIVTNLIGTVNMDKVNGGILATTSFFTRDACELITKNKMQYQIKMHDYDKIRNLLDKVV